MQLCRGSCARRPRGSLQRQEEGGRGLLGREEEGRLLGREGKVSVGQSVLNLKNCSVQGRHLGIITQAASRVQS